MCGIAGIFDFKTKNTSEALRDNIRKMLIKMRHRGPDDRGEESFIKGSGERLHLGLCGAF
jgi:asparagine synthetase B (glutamine-hydrolysing)